MKGKLKILSIIPARGGSKGLPKKNIYSLNGKPLIAYSIEASILSGVISKTVVSSENSEILHVSENFGAETIVRPEELATDSATSESVIEHVINYYKGINENYDIIVLLQPTSPLRDSFDIRQAVDVFINSKADSLISVYEPGHTPYKAFKLNSNGFLTGLVDSKAPFMRRQDLPKSFMPNGAIYITYCDLFLRTKSLFAEKTVPYVMEEDKSIDIDNLKDILKCESILKK